MSVIKHICLSGRLFPIAPAVKPELSIHAYFQNFCILFSFREKDWLFFLMN